MIEALPPPPTELSAYEMLNVEPQFDPEQRSWERTDRLHMLLELQSFLFPMSMHLELAYALDGMMRHGYIGRAPLTPDHIRRFQANYEKQKAGAVLGGKSSSTTAQLSALLIGLPGMGKTSTVRRWLANVPQVIYHPDYSVYQVTYLHVEMPSDGMSVKGMALAILQKLDALIPGADYYNTYAAKGRAGADSLMRSVARVMNAHFVGCLIADEVQNLTNAHKAKQTVMTELVSACNDLGLPILFIGTNKAAEVFSLDFRQSRRATGHGIRRWDRLHDCQEPDADNEWTQFAHALWQYQWVRNPVEPSDHLIGTLYRYSQGVIDVAIKLFAAAQARAIHAGTETLTAVLLEEVYRTDMQLLHPMLEALRDNDLERLAQLPDIKPTDLSEMLSSFNRKARFGNSAAFSIGPGDPTFQTRIATALMAAGSDEGDAMHLAQEVASAGKAKNLDSGIKEAVKLRSKLKPVPKSTPSTSESEEDLVGAELDPSDYRRAISLAKVQKTTVFEQLKVIGAARPLEDLLPLT